jgi:hypothetical protein
MDEKKQKIFRAKALNQVNNSADLSDCIRVTTPSAWLLALAAVIILASFAVWGFFGSVKLTDSNGNTEQIRPIELLIGERLGETEDNNE